MEDTYRTIIKTVTGTITEKRSKFIAYVHHVTTTEEVKTIITRYKKEYYDARHVCWAYMIGSEEKEFRANDDGEPSGTAGKPILGQIRSNELTNILIVVIRYFGGVKLGTSGLIAAYKTAAAEALQQAEIVEQTINETITIHFEYPFLNDVMKIVKEEAPTILSQTFDMQCDMTLSIRKKEIEKLRNRLQKVETLVIK